MVLVEAYERRSELHLDADQWARGLAPGLSKVGDSLIDNFDARGVRRMRAQKRPGGIRQATEKQGAGLGVVASFKGDDRADRVRCQLGPLRKTARCNDRPEACGLANLEGVGPAGARQAAEDFRTNGGLSPLLREMLSDVMSGLVSQNESNLIGTAGFVQQTHRENDQGLAPPVHSVERIHAGRRITIDQDCEITVLSRCLGPAHGLGHRLNPLNNIQKACDLRPNSGRRHGRFDGCRYARHEGQGGQKEKKDAHVTAGRLPYLKGNSVRATIHPVHATVR